MRGHSRSKNGVALLAYVPRIHVSHRNQAEVVDGRDKPGHDEQRNARPYAVSLSPPSKSPARSVSSLPSS